MKKLLGFFTLLMLTNVASASSLDLLDAKGGFDARLGQEYFQANGSITNNIVMNFTQGVRFYAAPWVEPYVGYNKAQATYIVGSGDTESLYGGIRNRTWLPNMQFGLEYRSTVVPDNPSIKSIVGYVAIHEDWDLNRREQ